MSGSLVVAFSIVELGYVHEAEDLLAKHVKAQSGAASNATYKAALEEVQLARRGAADAR